MHLQIWSLKTIKLSGELDGTSLQSSQTTVEKPKTGMDDRAFIVIIHLWQIYEIRSDLVT